MTHLTLSRDLQYILHQGFNAEHAENMAMHSVDAILIENGFNCLAIGLPEPIGVLQLDHRIDIDHPGIATLTDEKRLVANAVLESVDKKRRDELPNHSCFYVDAPGGCGKTYMFNTIITYLRRNNFNVCSGAWTSLASTLLAGGKTIHILFKFPVPLTEASVCNVPATSDHANHLRNLDSIILDEASMMPSFILHAIDKALRDITGIAAVFGGKVVLLGEYFRQVLLILSRGTREAIIEICIKNSPL
ncbi:ATP-dependent DNA helicase PIF1-like [Octopus vulgaris]|uniref:ATP-dependent DNA helicase n=1 Tax=Octopus vulgaris TaxID=6645 RepID=A0AA36B369_OCTVU|nr:ATP-dependent DNA helicase PIF1-like [Octopus vulgaris]